MRNMQVPVLLHDTFFDSSFKRIFIHRRGTRVGESCQHNGWCLKKYPAMQSSSPTRYRHRLQFKSSIPSSVLDAVGSVPVIILLHGSGAGSVISGSEIINYELQPSNFDLVQCFGARTIIFRSGSGLGSYLANPDPNPNWRVILDLD